MRTRWLLTATTLLAVMGALATVSCIRRASAGAWSLPRPVRITGGGDWMILFPSWGSWGGLASEGGTAGLQWRDGDWVVCEKMFVYRASDGPNLEVKVDGQNLLLAGKVISVELDKEKGGAEWLAKATKTELRAVRLLALNNGPDATWRAPLDRLAAANPGVGLVFGEGVDWQRVLPRFRPRVLALAAGKLDPERRRILADQRQVETLIIKGDDAGSFDALILLHGLRRLAITEWNVEKAGPLPAGLDRLRSIMIPGAKLKDLAALDAAPAGVVELSAVDCDELTDLGALARRPGLRTLILTGSKKVRDLSVLDGLTRLQWVGLPPETTQDQFTAFVGQHPELRILELVGCQQVKDLAPLRQLPKLEGLVLGGPVNHLEVLRELKSLRFIGVDKETFKKNPDQIADLRKALPDALVVPVGGLCVGSGWILLLLPAVVLMSMVPRRPRAAPGGGCPG